MPSWKGWNKLTMLDRVRKDNEDGVKYQVARAFDPQEGEGHKHLHSYENFVLYSVYLC